IEFSQGLFEPKEPCIWAKDVTEKTTLWAEIGVPPKKKLMHALKQLTEASIRVYFLSEDEIIEFCHHMRGAKTNWVERAEFFLLDQNLIDELAEQLSLRSYWSLSICDHILYLAANESNFQSPVTLVNIWEWYQESLMENSAS
ncbi:MAG: YaeQ family protein, partial [Bdellovibrionales bacterium]|nr:YaeQ family protein [Bdellovibrionales bacterium]